ncbi:unnamed protein product [Rotaria socialis]
MGCITSKRKVIAGYFKRSQIMCAFNKREPNASSLNNSQTNGMLVGGSTAFFVVIVIIIAGSIVQIVIVKFAFKLARLIEAKKASFCQQI